MPPSGFEAAALDTMSAAYMPGGNGQHAANSSQSSVVLPTPTPSGTASQIAAMQDAMRQRRAHAEVEHARALADRHRRWESPNRDPREHPHPQEVLREQGDNVYDAASSVPASPSLSGPPSYSLTVDSKRPIRSDSLAPPGPAFPRVSADDTLSAADCLSRSPSTTTKASALVVRHRSPSAASLAPPLQLASGAVSPRSPASLRSLPIPPTLDHSPPKWGVSDPSDVRLEVYTASTLRDEGEMPSLSMLRSYLVRLYPQLGTRTMASLKGMDVPPVTLEGQVNDDALPLPLWRSDDAGSARGDVVAATFPPDPNGRYPNTAAGLYIAAENMQSGALIGAFGSSWSSVAHQAHDYAMTPKQSKKLMEKMRHREQDLSVEAIGKQERAEVLITVYTEQRRGSWQTRRPVRVGPGAC